MTRGALNFRLILSNFVRFCCAFSFRKCGCHGINASCSHLIQKRKCTKHSRRILNPTYGPRPFQCPHNMASLQPPPSNHFPLSSNLSTVRQVQYCSKLNFEKDIALNRGHLRMHQKRIHFDICLSTSLNVDVLCASERENNCPSDLSV